MKCSSPVTRVIWIKPNLVLQFNYWKIKVKSERLCKFCCLMIVVVEIDVISFRLVNILSFLVNHCSYMFGFVLVVYFYYIFVVVVLGKKN